MAKVRVNDESGCWLWVGSINEFGYAQFFDVKCRRAHRWAYERWVGAIPAGSMLSHLCGQRACVNPEHLELVARPERGAAMSDDNDIVPPDWEPLRRAFSDALAATLTFLPRECERRVLAAMCDQLNAENLELNERTNP